jgi:hypothetical protein
MIGIAKKGMITKLIIRTFPERKNSDIRTVRRNKVFDFDNEVYLTYTLSAVRIYLVIQSKM